MSLTTSQQEMLPLMTSAVVVATRACEGKLYTEQRSSLQGYKSLIHSVRTLLSMSPSSGGALLMVSSQIIN